MTQDQLDRYRQDLEKHKTDPVNIAIIGQSRVGKSTFVNKIRGFYDEYGVPRDELEDDPLFAEVGLEQTTFQVSEYDFPGENNIKIFDLPGAGTEEFPMSIYEKTVNFERYDVFILLIHSTTFENDQLIFEKIKRSGKPYFVARTKTDEHLNSYVRAHYNKLSIDQLKDQWKDQCDNVLRKACQTKLKDPQLYVYLLSMMDFQQIELKGRAKHLFNHYDNAKLEIDLLKSLGDVESTALAFQLRASSKEAIDFKVEKLKARLWKIAVVSGGVAAIPVPGVSLLVDVPMIKIEMEFHKKQLGIDQKTLAKRAFLMSTTASQFVDAVIDRFSKGSSSGSWSNGLKSKFIKSFMSNASDIPSYANEITKVASVGASVAISEAMESGLKFAIPVVGSVFAAAISGSTTYSMLYANLIMSQEFALSAYDISEEFLKQ